MTTIESFFVLAALVVLVGVLVWRRDIRTGRIPRPKRRLPAMSLRERLGDTAFRKQSSAASALSAGARFVDTPGAPPAGAGRGVGADDKGGEGR
jgi:hypothetical protein